MMYPFLTLNDGTEITHSEFLPEDGGHVRVYVEKPDAKDCFHNAYCILPEYRWEKVNGFTAEELARYQEIIASTAHLILRFSKEGGFDHAANF